jgi:hypothetical protein
LLLVLTSAVILRSDSRESRDHILLSQIRDSLDLEGQVPVFISHRNRVVQLYTHALVPISSPTTTRREVFEPASTRECCRLKSKLRRAVSRPACLGIKHSFGV